LADTADRKPAAQAQRQTQGGKGWTRSTVSTDSGSGLRRWEGSSGGLGTKQTTRFRGVARMLRADPAASASRSRWPLRLRPCTPYILDVLRTSRWLALKSVRAGRMQILFGARREAPSAISLSIRVVWWGLCWRHLRILTCVLVGLCLSFPHCKFWRPRQGRLDCRPSSTVCEN